MSVLHFQKQPITLATTNCTFSSNFLFRFHHRLIVITHICNHALLAMGMLIHTNPLPMAEHIHMPNPSLWPLLLGVAVAVTIGGLLFVSSAPWISLIAIVCVLITMLGWALEDPIAPIKEKFVAVYRAVVADQQKSQSRPAQSAQIRTQFSIANPL